MLLNMQSNGPLEPKTTIAKKLNYNRKIKSCKDVEIAAPQNGSVHQPLELYEIFSDLEKKVENKVYGYSKGLLIKALTETIDGKSKVPLSKRGLCYFLLKPKPKVDDEWFIRGRKKWRR